MAEAEILPALYHNRRLVRRIDAPYIDSVKVLTGEAPATSEEHLPAQLEYTLRVDSADRTLDIEVGSGNDLLAELQVEFKGLQEQEATCPWFEFRLESSASEGCYGWLIAWDFANEQWAYVPTKTPDDDDYIVYPMPDISCREVMMLKPTPGQNFMDPEEAGHMIVRLVMMIGEDTVIRHDLLQVVRAPIPIESYVDPESAFARSDTDYDGWSDGSDLTRFLNRWASDKPAADVDFDNDIDTDDYDLFMASWAAEQ